MPERYANQRWPESLFPTPLLFQKFWIRFWQFTFENPTPVQTPAIIIDPTVIYPCFYVKKWSHRLLLLPKLKKSGSGSGSVFSQIFDSGSGSTTKTQNLAGVDSGFGATSDQNALCCNFTGEPEEGASRDPVRDRQAGNEWKSRDAVRWPGKRAGRLWFARFRSAWQSGILSMHLKRNVRSGLHNVRPARAFLAPRESFLNCTRSCKSSTSNKDVSFQNFLRTFASKSPWQRNLLDFCGPRQIYVYNLTLRTFSVAQVCCGWSSNVIDDEEK